MDQLADLLGIDLSSPEMVRADHLAQEDQRLMDELVKVRVDRGISQRDVARIMGVSQPRVCQFEASGSNPRLSTIRRYAMAVGALIRHTVEPDHGQLFDGSWQTFVLKVSPAIGTRAAGTLHVVATSIHNTGAASFPTPDGIDGDGGPVVARQDFALAA